ncbi:MAG: hypothetical protein KDA71_18670, partial [Planctomycetales bacterium]|nr:hypothetical protein [Planctomycetales bacterium]
MKWLNRRQIGSLLSRWLLAEYWLPIAVNHEFATAGDEERRSCSGKKEKAPGEDAGGWLLGVVIRHV